jgi:TonB family protein
LVFVTFIASIPVVQQQFEYMKLVPPHEAIVWQQPAVEEVVVVAPKPNLKPRLKPVTPREARPVLSARVAVPSLEVATKTLTEPRPEPEIVAMPVEPPKLQWWVQANNIGSSATPTLPKMAPRRVQTGGFGDPNGVPSQAKSGKAPNIAAIGSFELPVGPGYGNGTGGARGRRGIIPSSGFGNGIATDARPRPLGHGVQTTGFEGPAIEAKRLPQPQKPILVPLTIREKPSPAYTREARELRVEGEVPLEVFDGRVQVLRLVRGLGHGLDESAVRAAEKIRFSPAQREGQAVDISAVVHIVFQLS